MLFGEHKSRCALLLTIFLTACAGTMVSGDNIPPGNIRDLTLVEVSYFGAKLRFTSPGDDLFSGRASRFSVRYSTDAAFAKSPEKYFDLLGISAGDIPEPPIGGQKVEFFVKNLEPKTRYFIGIRAYDEAENFSDVSNIVEFMTEDVPGGSGEVIGKINCSCHAISSDGQRIYLIFPGISVLERAGEGFRISPISHNVPLVQGARVVWDGQKFVSLGGHIGGQLVQSPVAIYRDGRVAVMRNDGDVIPFGPNGFLGYGIMDHKIVKIGNGFAVIGGLKFLDPYVAKAVGEGKISKIGMEKILFFRVEGERVIWSILHPTATTYPISSLEPVAVSPDGKSVLVWGGNQSDSTISPSSDMNKLVFLQGGDIAPEAATGKVVWRSYTPFSGKIAKLYNTCEAHSFVRLIKVKPLSKPEEGVKDAEEIVISDLKEGDKFIHMGRPVIVERVGHIGRAFVIGRFREDGREFSGLVAIFSDGEREVFSRIVPDIGGRPFRFPDISDHCYAEYIDGKLFVLESGEIYIIGFSDHEVIYDSSGF